MTMQGEQGEPMEDLLLEWHLGLIDGDARVRIEEELRRNSALKAKSDRLGRILQPLDHWTTGPVPAHLEAAILRRVRTDSTRERVSGGAIESEAYAPPGPRYTLRDFLAVAACILLVFSVMIPGLSSARERSRRIACASNLKSVGDGVTMYQAAFGGWLPFAGIEDDAAWLPEASAARPYSSNSRHGFLLLKYELVNAPSNFVCPSSSGSAMNDEDLAGAVDFKSASNISYDGLNMAGPTPRAESNPESPYMSDHNPLFRGGRFNHLVDPDTANSRSHERLDGQNVLALDGGVRWMDSPIFGTRRDNVWLVDDLLTYNGTEAQSSPNDAFLVPGYPQTDPSVFPPAQ